MALTMFWRGTFTLIIGCLLIFFFQSQNEPEPVPAIKKQSQPVSLYEAPVVLATFFGGKDNIWYLRELVGSLHKARYAKKPVALMVVIGMGLDDEAVEEIGLWGWVEYVDVRTILFGHSMDPFKAVGLTVVRAISLDYLTRKFGHVVLVDGKMVLKRDVGISILASTLQSLGYIYTGQLEGYTRKEFLTRFTPFVETSFGFGAETPYPLPMINADAAKFYLGQSIPKAIDGSGSQNFCHLALRPELQYAPIFLPATGSTPETNSTRIGLGIPTKNKANVSLEESPLIKVFLPTLNASITEVEWSRFGYVLYLGYDHGDPLLDTEDKSEFEKAVHAICPMIEIRYYRVPASKWLSYIWNLLFTAAIHDGCDYYYQLNDDVAFKGEAWTTAFTQTLASTNGLGVMGHSDLRWSCTLLTQAFVSATHYKIFGAMFPLEIRDWFTDNWITTVYGVGLTRCGKEWRIGNGSGGQRYRQCEEPAWREAVMAGQKRIAAWRKANFL